MWTGRNMGGWVEKWRSQKRSSKTINIVSYALKVSVNGVTRVFVVHFRSLDTFKVCRLSFTVNIHVSTKTCVTDNKFVLHEALHMWHPFWKNSWQYIWFLKTFCSFIFPIHQYFYLSTTGFTHPNDRFLHLRLCSVGRGNMANKAILRRDHWDVMFTVCLSNCVNCYNLTIF